MTLLRILRQKLLPGCLCVGCLCDRLDHVFLLGAVCDLVLWVRKAVECFKHCLVGHISRSMEDNGAENDLNNGDQ